MGPCKVIYIQSNKRWEIACFFLEKKQITTTNRKGNQWEILEDNHLYMAHYQKENIETVLDELNNIDYEDLSKDVYILSICAPSKKHQCIDYLDQIEEAIIRYLQEHGVKILT